MKLRDVAVLADALEAFARYRNYLSIGDEQATSLVAAWQAAGAPNAGLEALDAYDRLGAVRAIARDDVTGPDDEKSLVNALLRMRTRALAEALLDYARPPDPAEEILAPEMPEKAPDLQPPAATDGELLF